MTSELYVRNIDNKLFEIKNSKESFLVVDDCNLLLDRDKTGKMEHWFEVEKSKELIQKFNKNEDAERVKHYLFAKLKDKADLKLAIQAIKKMDDVSQNFIENQKRKLRTDYFEFKIIDICNELNIEIG